MNRKFDAVAVRPTQEPERVEVELVFDRQHDGVVGMRIDGLGVTRPRLARAAGIATHGATPPEVARAAIDSPARARPPATVRRNDVQDLVMIAPHPSTA